MMKEKIKDKKHEKGYFSKIELRQVIITYLPSGSGHYARSDQGTKTMRIYGLSRPDSHGKLINFQC